MPETPFSRRKQSRGPLPSSLEAAAAHARRKALKPRAETPTRYIYRDEPFSSAETHSSRSSYVAPVATHERYDAPKSPAAPDSRRSEPVYRSRREHSEAERLQNARSLYRGYTDGVGQANDLLEGLARADERVLTGKSPDKLPGSRFVFSPNHHRSRRHDESLFRVKNRELFGDQDVGIQDLALELERELARLEARQRGLDADRLNEDRAFEAELARLDEELLAEELPPRFDLRARRQGFTDRPKLPERVDPATEESLYPWSLDADVNRGMLRGDIPSPELDPDGEELEAMLARLEARGSRSRFGAGAS